MDWMAPELLNLLLRPSTESNTLMLSSTKYKPTFIILPVALSSFISVVDAIPLGTFIPLYNPANAKGNYKIIITRFETLKRHSAAVRQTQNMALQFPLFQCAQ